MNRIVYKSFKTLEKEHKKYDNSLYTLDFIQIYDENGTLVNTFTSEDGDSNKGFMQKAQEYARGGRLRIKYVYDNK